MTFQSNRRLYTIHFHLQKTKENLLLLADIPCMLCSVAHVLPKTPSTNLLKDCKGLEKMNG